ncbi:MAG: V-type ATPase subunit, partial [Clostridia bacterium]|nr:V-type ATPase subunit [Clostridia bacterium]
MADLVYTNSIARSLENSLLGSEKITRMVFADSYEDGMRVLAESGFGSGLTEGGHEAMIAAEEDKLSRFMSEVNFGHGIDSFAVRGDYHNAKVFAKSKYARIQDVSAMLAPKGKIEVDELKDKILKDDYASLPQPMADALKDIDVSFANGQRSPKYIDERLDKAMYADALDIAKKGKSNSIIKYWQTEIDYANVSDYLRCKIANKSAAYMKSGLIDGGTIAKDVFVDLYDESEDVFIERMRFTSVADGIAEYVEGNRSFARLEAWKDHAPRRIVKQDSYAMFAV